MIASLPRFMAATKGCSSVSRRKKNAIFDVAARLTLIAEKARSDGGTGLASSAATERRKALKLGLELLVRGVGHDGLDRSFRKAHLTKTFDPGEALENLVILEGLHAFVAGEHPFIMLRRMTAFLGTEFLEKTDAWLTARIARRRRTKGEDLLVPGELPDILRSLSRQDGRLERVARAAGRDIMSASLAGCPRESLLLAKPAFGRIGGAILEDNMVFLRSRLSTEEIAGAQSAFLEILHEHEAQEGLDAAEGQGETETDPDFVRELTGAILALDEKAIKAGVSGMEGKHLAAAMQGMEPVAHERILASLGKREEKRILDSIDDFDPLTRTEVAAAAVILIARLAAAAEKLGKLPETLKQRLEALRNWK